MRHYILDNKEFATYLLTHSNLTGKRGNLELAFAFAEYIEKHYPVNPELALAFCEALINENPPDKHVTGSEEFLPFCGVLGLCYTLSVVITGIEQEGFTYLEDLLSTDHPVIRKIVRENLKKKRLLRLNAENVSRLQQKLARTLSAASLPVRIDMGTPEGL